MGEAIYNKLGLPETYYEDETSVTSQEKISRKDSKDDESTGRKSSNISDH